MMTTTTMILWIQQSSLAASDSDGGPVVVEAIDVVVEALAELDDVAMAADVLPEVRVVNRAEVPGE